MCSLISHTCSTIDYFLKGLGKIVYCHWRCCCYIQYIEIQTLLGLHISSSELFVIGSAVRAGVH